MFDFKPLRQFHVVFALILTAFFLFSGCGSSSQEKEAKAIYQKARELSQKGQEVEAMREFKRLVDFSDTKTFKKAEAELRKDGITIGSSLNSWTIKQMFEVKNSIINQGKETHPDGDATVLFPENDAWGKSFRISYANDTRYLFYVFSAGPDRLFNTDDDLKIFHTGTGPKIPAQVGVGNSETGAYGQTKTMVAKRQSNKGRSPRESVVDLKDLLKEN